MVLYQLQFLNVFGIEIHGGWAGLVGSCIDLALAQLWFVFAYAITCGWIVGAFGLVLTTTEAKKINNS